MDWKETVTQVSERVFPGISQKINEDDIENEVMSNLPLQMAMYFNVVFFPAWTIILVIFLKNNFFCFTELYKFLAVAIIITMILIEIVRLRLGYEGNLRDKIPELAGFWILSVFLQLPLEVILLCNPYFKLWVIEVVVQSVMFLLLIMQLIFGYQALKRTSSNQAVYYKMSKLMSEEPAGDFKTIYKET